jgi:thiamine-monophosphate kinase
MPGWNRCDAICEEIQTNEEERMRDEEGPGGLDNRTPSGNSLRNEFDFIKAIRERALRSVESTQRASSFSPHPSSLLAGIGDDAAVFSESAGRDTVVTTDLLIEDVDFRRETTSPRLLGEKALAVSLSDIAAMGARPRWALLSVGVPQEIWDSDFLDQFYEGFLALADRYGVCLVGGDVSRSPEKIVLDSIVLGECTHNHSIMRRGAQAGDQLFVTGSLGGSAAGLRLLDRGARLTQKGMDNETDKTHHDPDSYSVDQLILRHLRPEPRVGWGLVLGEERLASAMIDISDGLSSDVNHLCEESNVGALIDASLLPIDPLVIELCGRRALDPLLLGLHGGEDFELLFTVQKENLARLPRRVDGIAVSRIGEITDQPGKIRIAEKNRVWDLPAKGFEHFR